MLTENEFLVLDALRDTCLKSQREIAEKTELSLGTVNNALKSLVDRSYIDHLKITESGLKALDPYRVNNAVILAAGVSKRFVPISYEKPKGTLTVKGEVLIERLIRQVKEVGINDITVVVGYMKEQYFYLEDSFDVRIVISDVFLERNNNSSIKLVENQLSNTYIITSDSYFVENVFRPYVYKAYYAAVFAEGQTEEWCLRAERRKRISKVTIGGADEWVMLGEAYFDRAFSKRYVEILNTVYNSPETAPKLWEGIYADHLQELDMDIKKYPQDIIYEFDSLDQVSVFDPEFIKNINSDVLNNICKTLSCNHGEIENIEPIEKGLSNVSFSFSIKDRRYVYRHPGVATQGILNRAVEAEVELIACDLGLDQTFLYQDSDKGWKISYFIDITAPFDYHNKQHVKTALDMIKKLHKSGKTVDSKFDIHEETKKIKALLVGTRHLDIPGFTE